jgi:hypothetical protein
MARVMRGVLAFVCGAIGLAALCASARAEGRLEYPPAPCSVLSGQPCHPSFCSVFQRGPCFPDYLLLIGEGVRLTVAAAESDAKDKPLTDRRDEGQLVNTIHDMFEVLRSCWVPPPRNRARHGMEYTIIFAFKRDGELLAPARMTYMTHDVPADVRDTYRDAVDATLKRCTPMHFSTGMAGAIAGRPISIRFIDDRMFGGDSGKSDDSSK